LAKQEGLLVGISAGANVFAAIQIAEKLEPHQRVITMLCDTGERYLSVPFN
jgi:cysteine synthase A